MSLSGIDANDRQVSTRQFVRQSVRHATGLQDHAYQIPLQSLKKHENRIRIRPDLACADDLAVLTTYADRRHVLGDVQSHKASFHNAFLFDRGPYDVLPGRNTPIFSRLLDMTQIDRATL